jgi:hypothetical protein
MQFLHVYTHVQSHKDEYNNFTFSAHAVQQKHLKYCLKL